jgi:hypothetical protein
MTWPLNYHSPLFFEGWLEFNRYKWNLSPLRLKLSPDSKERPFLETVLYLNKRGRIVQPPLNPYLPLRFEPTPTTKISRIHRQWIATSSLLVEEFARRKVKGYVSFPPEVIDVRPWQWRGYLVEVRYTLFLKLPYDIPLLDDSQRNKIQKAEKAGFTCEILETQRLFDAWQCLSETEARQGFQYNLRVKDLEVASKLMGKEKFRVYLCRSKNGEPASCRIVLAHPGYLAIDWVAGTRKSFLNFGTTQLLIWHILKDLEQLNISVFDFAGADLPTVSAQKLEWGGELLPYNLIRPINLRNLAALSWRAFTRRKQRS